MKNKTQENRSTDNNKNEEDKMGTNMEKFHQELGQTQAAVQSLEKDMDKKVSTDEVTAEIAKSEAKMFAEIAKNVKDFTTIRLSKLKFVLTISTLTIALVAGMYMDLRKEMKEGQNEMKEGQKEIKDSMVTMETRLVKSQQEMETRLLKAIEHKK